jgi:hypothetical protein
LTPSIATVSPRAELLWVSVFNAGAEKTLNICFSVWPNGGTALSIRPPPTANLAIEKIMPDFSQ